MDCMLNAAHRTFDGHHCPPAQPAPTSSFWDGTTGGGGGKPSEIACPENPLPTNTITVSSHTTTQLFELHLSSAPDLQTHPIR